MSDLFDEKFNEDMSKNAPLADRMRPKNLADFVGQEHIVGPNSLLKKAIQNDDIPSIIFWGPPGSGKTTLAKIIAEMTNSSFIEMSAVTSGVADLRLIIKEAHEKRKFNNKRTIVFIDEIHRWNKAQQDALLPHIEKGIITLIGATTENPSFEVISPLLSRSRVYVLKPLSFDDLKKIIDRSLKNKELGFGDNEIEIEKEAEEFLIHSANGDARIILNALEVAIKNFSNYGNKKIKINKKLIEETLQHRALQYDKGGEEHHNVISAFIKSLRGSNIDGALYWLARMIKAGEDPKFIARRMLVLASEDIGNADTNALVVANSVFNAVERIGLPECRINLAQGVVYLAKAKKSNKSYDALCKAEEVVEETMNLPVPLHLRNAPTGLMKGLGYGKGYKYTHTEDDSKQTYLPNEIKDKKFFEE